MSTNELAVKREVRGVHALIASVEELDELAAYFVEKCGSTRPAEWTFKAGGDEIELAGPLASHEHELVDIRALTLTVGGWSETPRIRLFASRFTMWAYVWGRGRTEAADISALVAARLRALRPWWYLVGTLPGRIALYLVLYLLAYWPSRVIVTGTSTVALLVQGGLAGGVAIGITALLVVYVLPVLKIGKRETARQVFGKATTYVILAIISSVIGIGVGIVLVGK